MEHFIFNPPNKPAGLYHITDMPEQSDFEEIISGSRVLDADAFDKAIETAISQSILVENEKEVKQMINTSNGLVSFAKLEPGEIYQLDCKVEKKLQEPVVLGGINVRVVVVSPIEEGKISKAFRELREEPKGTLCNECGKPVGNTVFTVCDNCWDEKKEQPSFCPTIKDCKHDEPRHCLLNGCKQDRNKAGMEFFAHNKHLFKALQDVCNFTALETEMAEIIEAVEKDNKEQPKQEVNGQTVLKALMHRVDEENLNGQPIVKIVEDKIGGSTTYLRHDAVVKEINTQLKSVSLPQESSEEWDNAFTEAPVRLHPKTEEFFKSKFHITRKTK